MRKVFGAYPQKGVSNSTHIRKNPKFNSKCSTEVVKLNQVKSTNVLKILRTTCTSTKFSMPKPAGVHVGSEIFVRTFSHHLLHQLDGYDG